MKQGLLVMAFLITVIVMFGVTKTHTQIMSEDISNVTHCSSGQEY
jgi:hypothetical protein